MGVVRLFLALVVVADLWRVFMLPSFPLEDTIKFGFNAGYAVMFFYAINGFLITYTLSRNYERDRGGALRFYENRFIRIFSLYWPLIILAFLVIGGAWDGFLSAGFFDKLTGIFLLGMDWRVAFASYPTPHFDAAIGGLHQAWTLGAELTFYLVASLLMPSWRIGAALLLVSFGLRAAFVIALGPGLDNIWTYHFVGTTFRFFMLGHPICLAAQRWPQLARPALGVVLLVCSFAIMMYGGSYADFDGPRLWGSAVLFTLALPGLFEATKGVRWMNAAGDLSYPIYLIHRMVLILIGPWLMRVALPISFMPPAEAGYVSTAAFLAATTVGAVIVHRAIETPVSHAMHWLVDYGLVGRAWRWARASI